jgi:hypothetical protein
MPEEVHAPAVDRLLLSDLIDDVVQEERAVLGRSPVDGIVRVGPDDDDFLFLSEILPGRDIRLAALARTVKRQEQRQLPLRRRSRRNEEEKNPLLPLPGDPLLRDLRGLAFAEAAASSRTGANRVLARVMPRVYRKKRRGLRSPGVDDDSKRLSRGGG